MLNRSKYLVVLLCLSLISCTTMQAVHEARYPAIAQEISVGDEVAIELRSGVSVNFKVIKVSQSGVDGEMGGGNRHINYADISSISVKKFSAGRTSALTAVVTLVAVAIVVLAEAIGNINIQ